MFRQAIEKMIPGGVKPTDVWRSSPDDPCSRCGQACAKDGKIAMLRSEPGMLIYCDHCLGLPQQQN